jgi:hypothetical protein
MENRKRKNKGNENTIIKTEDEKKRKGGKERKGKERKVTCLQQMKQI